MLSRKGLNWRRRWRKNRDRPVEEKRRDDKVNCRVGGAFAVLWETTVIEGVLQRP